MKTTITEIQHLPCSKCGGRGFIPYFQHRKSGECFRCGATGVDPKVKFMEREMTDLEVKTALADAGFPIVEFERPETGDFLIDLFPSDEEMAARAEAMKGARMLLAALEA